MTFRDWLHILGFVNILLAQIAIIDRIENPKPRKQVSNTCVVDGRTVYCVLPKTEQDSPVLHGEVKK